MSYKHRGGVADPIPALMEASERGDRAAAEQLFETLYLELHRTARLELARRAGPLSLSATTLLHEAYLAMRTRAAGCFPEPSRFMGYAAKVMRRLIIDYARARQAQKRGGLIEITSLDTAGPADSEDHRETVAIGEALEELAKVDPALADVVDMKFFCGLSFGEIAALRNVSERTVQRNWERARLYLYQSIRADLT